MIFYQFTNNQVALTASKSYNIRYLLTLYLIRGSAAATLIHLSEG